MNDIDIRAALASARKKERERCAVAIGPKDKKPCDCITLHDDSWWLASCDCRNGGDSDRAAQWCESANNAQTMRALTDEEQ